MIKNWTVKAKNIKRRHQGFRRVVRYLTDQKEPSHHNTEITVLNNRSDNIIFEFDRYEYLYTKRQKKKGGRPLSSIAKSYSFNLPNELRPTADQWKEISKYLIREYADYNNVAANEMAKISHIVLHEQNDDTKPQHIHLVFGKHLGGEPLKNVFDKKLVNQMKLAFNFAVKKVAGFDYRNYQPKLKQTRKKAVWEMQKEERIAELDSELSSIRQNKQQLIDEMSDKAVKLLRNFLTYEKRWMLAEIRGEQEKMEKNRRLADAAAQKIGKFAPSDFSEDFLSGFRSQISRETPRNTPPSPWFR